MRVEPFLHVGLVLVFSRLISEYVGDLAGFLWYFVDTDACGAGVPPGIRKEFQYRRCLSEMLVGDLARWEPRRLGMDGDRKVRMWSI